jgi:hypothetical protein
VLHSWPLASDPGGLSRLDNDDAALNTWAIAWVAHIVPRAPLNLFEAPIFYPEAHTLAYSEHMVVPALMGAPLFWLGASPVLEHNVLLIAGLALSGWAMCLVMARWTGSLSAGVIAGLLYAFNAHILTRFVHLQAHHVEFFPVMLYAFDRVLSDGRRRDAILLAAAFVLQALSGNYLLVFATFALVAAAAVRWRELNRKELLVAVAISAALVAPFLWPYYQVSRDQGLVRSVSEVSLHSAGWRDYLATGGRLHYAWWSHQFFEGRTALFPGFTALLLAAVALTRRPGPGDRRVRMVLAIGGVGVALSLGTSLPGYAWLHEHVPLLSGLRNAARWGWLALAAVAMLAGFGVAAAEKYTRAADLSRRSASAEADGTKGSNRRWQVVAVVLGLLVTIEAIRTPVAYTPFTGIPHIYDRLASEPNVVLAEFPFYSGAAISRNGPYELANTRYFQPLVNGYSGFQTAGYEERGRALNSFPSGLAIAQLQVMKVTHVMVHTEAFARRYGDAALKAIDSVIELQLVVNEHGISLYRLRSLK